MNRTYNKSALRAMIHYVAREYALQPEKVGKVKLHKILWFTEVRSIRRSGHPIAGETFIRHKFGPFSTHFDQVLNELAKERLVHVEESDEEFDVTKLVGKGTPDRSALTDEQWHLLDGIMRGIAGDHTASTISERSHDEMWDAFDMYEDMPTDLAAIRIVPTPKSIREAIAADFLK